MSGEAESRAVDTFAAQSMRLDLFLKLSRLIPRRTLAREVCDHGAVSVNGLVARGSRVVRVGDLIALRQRHKLTAVKVARIPRVSPTRSEAATLYEFVGSENGQRPPE